MKTVQKMVCVAGASMIPLVVCLVLAALYIALILYVIGPAGHMFTQWLDWQPNLPAPPEIPGWFMSLLHGVRVLGTATGVVILLTFWYYSSRGLYDECHAWHRRRLARSHVALLVASMVLMAGGPALGMSQYRPAIPSEAPRERRP